MFKLKQSASFFWPVDVNVMADGGQHQKQTFDAEFLRLGQKQLDELSAKVKVGEMNDADFVRQVLVGWRGVVDDGVEVPFSAGALDQLLDLPGLAASIVIAFGKAHAGIVRKN